MSEVAAVTMESIYEELKRIEEVMATREDIEALTDSWEILQDPETMKHIQDSEKVIAEGKVKEITSVQDMLDEL